ncbi:hypothetical protein CYMTET_27478 [Cymbomonas tetramitiformis]|uniref:ABC transporter domain-containing protein n=1 Tax=Cymbomonas tetramitiformis TaxID=36881 RepID=A0AAE0KWW3_9CHLO|nr:hypothetical protein CYMTET_27478 [Cymbomonas tetramitiformis]
MLSVRFATYSATGSLAKYFSGSMLSWARQAGQDSPDAGQFTVGPEVDAMYVDQSRDSLNADNSVLRELMERGGEEIQLGGRTMHVRAYCGWYNFKGADHNKRVGDLSGGERNRLQLAKCLKQGGNVLMLDEPTNDLDVDTLRALEHAIAHFAGTSLIISHDRWFLDRLATHILAFEGDSKVVFFEGSYSEYDADLRRRCGNIDPSRIKYAPMPIVSS